MRKFKEGNSEKKLDRQEVEKHKNFDRLITNYQQVIDSVHKKPLYKSKKGFLLILLIILIVIVIVISNSEMEKTPSKNKIETDK